MFQILEICNITNTKKLLANGFKYKKDAINYLRGLHGENIYPFLEINCNGKLEKYSFKNHLQNYKINNNNNGEK